MKNMFYLLIIVFFAVSVSTTAKEEFTVFAVKGNSQFKHESKGDYSKLKTGVLLNNTDLVKLENGDYLSLLHKSGRTIELKRKGEYSIARLSETIKNSKADLNSKVASFVVNQLKSSQNILSNEDYRKSMKVTGAVERSSTTKQAGDAIALKVPLKFSTLSNTITCKWSSSKTDETFKFVLYDRFDGEVFTKEIIGNSFELDLNSLKLEPDNYYFWSVSDANNTNVSEKACFMALSPMKLKSINESIEMLKSEMDNPESAVNLFLIGGFYEQNNMIEEAMNYYKKAVVAEPEVQDYNNYLTVFLERNNINN